jgi:uncharacterized damage-inducible protein DinB
MSPEQGKMALQMYCEDAEREAAVTRKVLAAVPDDQGTYTPHATNMTAIDLAFHIASSEVWFLNSVADGSFKMEESKRPAEIAKPSDVVAYYDANLGPAMARAKAVSPADAAKIVDFFGMQFPNVVYLNFMVKHSIHHRGQLSTYLRPMGAKVPSIYGGSADEPFEMAAAK